MNENPLVRLQGGPKNGLTYMPLDDTDSVDFPATDKSGYYPDSDGKHYRYGRVDSMTFVYVGEVFYT